MTLFTNIFDVFAFKRLKFFMDVDRILDLSNGIIPTLFHKSCEKKSRGKWTLFNGKWCLKIALYTDNG